MTAHVVSRFAEHVASARDRELAPQARAAAIACILDLVTAVVDGLDAPGVAAVRKVALASHGAGPCAVWFAGASSSVAGAAWCNSAAAAVLDLDDGNRLARGHPGAAVIPAAIAAAQECGASFEELIAAIVIGYEIGVTVGAARRFYANTGMWSCHGVVAAVGFLRRTPPEQLAHAFAIAGMSAPNQLHVGGGPKQVFPVGSDVKEGIPWSTVTAINAVLLAEAGATGPLNLLDSEAHYAFGDLAGLGDRLHICGTYFKFQSCCRHVHAPVDALCGLIDQHGLDPREIEAIEVGTYSGALRLANPPEPVNLIDIQFSIPYCLGLAALDGPEALLPLTDAALARADASAFARKVTLVLDPDIERVFPAQTLTRIILSCGGRRYESPVTGPRGEASDAPSWAELEQKFRMASRLMATSEQQERLLSVIGRLQQGEAEPLLEAFAAMRLTRR